MRKRPVLILILLFSLFLSNPLRLNLTAQLSVKVHSFSEPPKIDGLLDDPCWRKAAPVTDFVQREPFTGEPATVKTEVFIGYDRHALYIAFKCYSDPDEITAKEMARDVDLSNDDRVQVILDTYNDKRNAYWFQIGPRGSIGDAIVSENGAGFNKAWDGLWSGKAVILDDRWEAEIAIPFKSMNFKRDQDTWGLKLIRYQKSLEEADYWPVANINTHRFQVSDAGSITGLKEMSQGAGVDLIPYGLGGLNISEGDSRIRPVASAGLEAYYNITPNLKASLTINTDFAQTEVDQQEINLTRFSLFYPEKRDFFLDGANYFNFGINGDQDNRWNTRIIPYFSRRIGLDESGNPIPVAYGGKITGKAGHWNIGAMYMKDQRGGDLNGHFAVTRITRNLGKQSHIGIISTYGNALFDSLNFVTGIDLKLATSDFMGDKNLSFIAYGLKSFTPERVSENDIPGRELSYGAELAYPNDVISFRAGHLEVQENFIAGLGFVPRTGIRQSYGQLTLGYRPERWGILQILAGGQLDHISNFDNELLTRDWEFTLTRIRFMTGDEIQYHIDAVFEYLDQPFTMYTDHTVQGGDYNFYYHTISLQSARKRKGWGMIKFRTGGFFDGTRQEIDLKTGTQVIVPLFLGGEVIRNDVRLAESSFIANIYRLNLNILFSPDITLYSFIQYDSESNKLGWQSRFQWIIKPGREIFLVWNSLGRDPFERYQIEDATARCKVKYTVRF